MALKIISSYNSLLQFIENMDVVNEVCHVFYYKQSSMRFLTNQTIWNIILEKTNNHQHHHYTNRKSLNHLKFKLGRYKDKHVLYNLLKYLSLEHFELKRGRNILKAENIETFQILQNSIDITPIYAMSISEYIQFYSPTEKIAYIKESISNNALPLPERFLSLKSFSDNHFHLGGGNNFSYRLHKILQNPKRVNFNHIPHTQHCQSFQNPEKLKLIFYATSILEKILLGYLIHNNSDFYSSERIKKNQKSFQQNLLWFSKALLENQFSLLERIVDNNQSLYDIRPKIDKHFFQYLSTTNYYNRLILKIIQANIKNEIHKADTFLWILFTEVLREHKNSYLKDFIFVYHSLRNIIHSFVTQETQEGGLEMFSSYSRSSIRRDKKNYELYDTFGSILDKNYTFYIEGRLIFHDSQEKIVKDIVQWYTAFIASSLEIKNSKNQIKFMLHYKKEKDKPLPNKQKNNHRKPLFLLERYQEHRRKIFQLTLVFLEFLGNKKYSNYKIYLPLTPNDKYLDDFYKRNVAIKEVNIKGNYLLLDLPTLISGIDVASLEYNSPPEIFAPVYNYIKNSRKLLDKPFQFSFHAGEDLEDIASSLRTIVESVIFLNLKKGDRLGHALSLGYNYKKSKKEFDNFLTTKGKALDNATFLYFIFYSLYHENNRHQYLDVFEQKILRLSAEIYGNDYTVHQHINAWLLRRNSPQQIKTLIYANVQHNGNNIIEKSAEYLKRCSSDDYYKNKLLYQYKLFFKHALQDVFKLQLKESNFFNRRYESARSDTKAWEILLRYHFETAVREEELQPIEEDFCPINTIQITQDLIMEHIIAQNDIIIEVMPTSNLLNSQISSYSKHPLFRFKPVDGDLTPYNHHNIRTTPLKIIINTDNPGFQATSYLNELFLVNEAAIKLGYHHKDIESYINEIVELGNMIFTGKAPQE